MFFKKPYWFKRRGYGWGWTPASWQGWFIMFVFMATLFAAIFVIDRVFETEDEKGWATVILALVWGAGLTFAIALRAPKPKWQWGQKAINAPEDDDYSADSMF